MRAVLAAIAAWMVVSSVAFSADVVSIGNTKFDFDAPAPPLSAGQQALFQRYRDAVNRRDENALMSLQDESMKSCTAVFRKGILRDLKETIPDTAKVRFFPSSGDIAREMGFGDLAYLSAQPTAVLGIDARSKTQDGIKIVTILRPVREVGGKLVLIPYCLTPMGKARLEQKAN